MFQFVLPEEICTDKSTAQRSQTTGRLVIRMPKVKYNPLFAKKPTVQKIKDEFVEKDDQENKSQEEKSVRYKDIFFTLYVKIFDITTNANSFSEID